jgi:hypothetical protein
MNITRNGPQPSVKGNVDWLDKVTDEQYAAHTR